MICVVYKINIDFAIFHLLDFFKLLPSSLQNEVLLFFFQIYATLLVNTEFFLEFTIETEKWDS